MKSILISSLFLLVAFFSCTDRKAESSNTEPVQREVNFMPDLPAMTGEEFNWFVVNCSGIDYMINTPDFSMSVSGQENIRADLGGISQNPVRRPESCKSIGLVIYKSGAEIMFVGDLYADENCQYVVFKKDNQEMYANELTPEGYQRYVNVLSEVKAKNQ